MEKLKSNLLLILTTSLLSAQEYQEEEESRDRLHSVKKAIASVHEVQTKELTMVNGFEHMFKDGKVTGQIRSLYSEISYTDAQNVYATAIGGFLKYELAEYKGFNAGVEFVTTNDIDLFSGSDLNRNSELSSSAQNYTQMSEAYLNYNYKDFSLRVGRQSIETPLADSDDIRMVSNSFEAYLATYEKSGFMLMGGILVSWQGYDAGLDSPWSNTGKDGTYLGGITYSDKFIDTSIWYYKINGEKGDALASNSFYGDIVGHFHLSQEFYLHIGGQYLQQDELDMSGVASKIYGATVELVAYNIGFNLAYNKSLKQQGKQSFSGFGGGTLFTNMDNMILDNIAVDRDVEVVVAGLSYNYKDIGILYAYGDFKGAADTAGLTEHIVEQNLGISYEYKDITLGAIYTQQDDKENTDVNGGDWQNVRVLVAYNF